MLGKAEEQIISDDKPKVKIQDTFSCGPINIKFAPHEICSISTPKPTDRTDPKVKVMWAELRKS